MVKDHSNSERGSPLSPHELLFPIRERERNVLFNTFYLQFYLRLYGVRHMVKDHSDSFPISHKGYFYMHNPTHRIIHTTAFVTPVVEHWLEREIAQWVHHEEMSREAMGKGT